MRLSKSADFALRIVVELAHRPEPQTMPVLSEKLKVPYHNLSKLIQIMSKAGIIQTRQGKNGGVQLLKNAAEISLKTVIDSIDGPTRLSDCSSGTQACSFTPTCKLKEQFYQIQKQIDTLFDEVKIASML